MPLRFSSKELFLLLKKPTAGKSRKGTRRGPVDRRDLSPLFNAKLAEPDFRGLAAFIEAKRTFGPSWRRGHGSASFASEKR